MRLSLLLLFTPSVLAYSHFIGHGYKSCLTCHYNAAGGGPLSPYGRALWGAEIAAKPFYWKNLSAEQLGEKSGFFFGMDDTKRVRPYAKYRGLYLVNNLKKESESHRIIHMQAALGSTIFITEDESFIFSGEIGYVPAPSGGNPNNPKENRQVISREYYFRYNLTEKEYLYFGFLDLPFGIRTPDHTAVNGVPINRGMNDQSHGLMYYRNEADLDIELYTFFFVGNLEQTTDVAQKGLTILIEKGFIDNLRLGTSLWYSQSEVVKKVRFSHHGRLGLRYGNALLYEVGYSTDQPTGGALKTERAYALLESYLKIKHGLYLFSQGDYAKAGFKATTPDTFRGTFGFLYFPAQRIELRTQLTQARSISPQQVTEDSLAWLTQLHLSF